MDQRQHRIEACSDHIAGKIAEFEKKKIITGNEIWCFLHDRSHRVSQEDGGQRLHLDRKRNPQVNEESDGAG